jgi:hypothetical protein
MLLITDPPKTYQQREYSGSQSSRRYNNSSNGPRSVPFQLTSVCFPAFQVLKDAHVFFSPALIWIKEAGFVAVLDQRGRFPFDPFDCPLAAPATFVAFVLLKGMVEISIR